MHDPFTASLVSFTRQLRITELTPEEPFLQVSPDSRQNRTCYVVTMSHSSFAMNLQRFLRPGNLNIAPSVQETEKQMEK